jgi:hypothetical protein
MFVRTRRRHQPEQDTRGGPALVVVRSQRAVRLEVVRALVKINDVMAIPVYSPDERPIEEHSGEASKG